MNLPKLRVMKCEEIQIAPDEYVVLPAKYTVALSQEEASHMLHRIETWPELVESLDWAMKYGEWSEALDGNPLMKMAFDKAKAILAKAEKGA